ncbi:MAG: fumarylacetoacetate hydrolase family protein, partial [Casimicrobiaceae bacterium]
MKLVRYGPPGKEKPGLVDADGKLRDLSRKVKDWNGASLAPAELAKIRKLDPKKLPPVKGRPRLGACVATTSKFVAIGLNYIDHAKETGSPIPEHPVVFFKSPTCIVGPNDDTMIPRDSTQMDYEVELGIVIGRTARYVEKKDALRYIAGYCLINDVSEREFQLKKSASQWSKGKGCDTFGPLGPWLVTTDELKDPGNLDMWLDVNGKRRQTGNTRTMIFSCAEVVADVSKYMTLLPGDVITTGTPPGVAMGMKPTPGWLKA